MQKHAKRDIYWSYTLSCHFLYKSINNKYKIHIIIIYPHTRQYPYYRHAELFPIHITYTYLSNIHFHYLRPSTLRYPKKNLRKSLKGSPYFLSTPHTDVPKNTIDKDPSIPNYLLCNSI